jgi:hypothetical protein
MVRWGAMTQRQRDVAMSVVIVAICVGLCLWAPPHESHQCAGLGPVDRLFGSCAAGPLEVRSEPPQRIPQ